MYSYGSACGIATLYNLLTLSTGEVACVDPDICYKICQSRSGCTNIAYPKLVLGLMGPGEYILKITSNHKIM